MAGARSKSKTGGKGDVTSREWISAARQHGVVTSGAGAGRMQMLAAENAGDGAAKKRTFKGRLYSGGVFLQWWGAAVIDLTGLEITAQEKPVLLNHGFVFNGRNANIGATTSISKDASGVSIEGVFLSNETAQGVVRDADDGFPWEMSIHATVREEEFVAPGKTAKVNGREVTGPVLIARKSVLREATICAVGADPYTQFSMAAAMRGQSIMPETSKSVLATDGEEEMVKKSEIDAEYIRKELPEVAKALAEAGDEDDPEKKPGEGEQPVKETQASATIVKLEAMAAGLTTGKAEWVLKAVRSGWTEAQASADLNQMLALELKATSEKLADATTKLEAALKGGGANPLNEPSKEQLREAGGAGGSKEGFAGAAGKDPNADWNASEELRAYWGKHCKGDARAAFMGSARQAVADGESYLGRPFGN